MNTKIDKKVSELMFTKQKDLPKDAIDFVKSLSAKVGYCGETCVTAFYDYCQIKLNMRCNNDYKITSERKKYYADSPPSQK